MLGSSRIRPVPEPPGVDFIAFPTDLYLRPHLRPRYSSLGLLFWSGPVAARIKVEAAARQLHVGGRVPTKSRPQLAAEEDLGPSSVTRGLGVSRDGQREEPAGKSSRAPRRTLGSTRGPSKSSRFRERTAGLG